jgi:type 2 lantibiotic biosynthesis protein LanM
MQEMASKTGDHASTLWQRASWWYRATPLIERIGLKQKNTDSQSSDTLGISDRAKRRLQSWKEQSPFDRDDYFARRLAMDALTEDDLLSLLDEPLEATSADRVPPPTWFIELLTAFTDDAPDDFPWSLWEETDQGSQALAFLTTLEPLLWKVLARLRNGLRELTHLYHSLPFDPQTIIPLLFEHIPTLLFPELSKTLVLEMHVARVQGQLQGETPEERFQFFLQRLRQPEHMLALLEEYAVLARQLIETLGRWVACELELMERLCADWEEIRRVFPPDGDPGVLVKIEQGAGDTHRGGHNVTVLTWSSGFRLVYKPRAMALDLHFQELLAWLNAKGQEPTFRTFSVIDKQTYGWCEFVPASECTSREEVERFYQRQGGYLALLYALAATDFHNENLIAAGEHPVLVDIEALFQPHQNLDEMMLQDNPAEETLFSSVLRIGLLPQRFWASEQAEGVDISGLGGAAGQLTPSPVPTWKETGTDQMRILRERVVMPPSDNQPKFNGQEINVLEYSESIVTGFAATYRLLMQLRDALLTEIVPRFAHDEIRYLLRPTRAYFMLLAESFHPNLLRDALDRDRLFDRLWIPVEQQPYLSRIIAAERADLLAGDIPFFTTYPDSLALVTSRGESIADFFEETGLDVVCKRIQQLEEQDLEKQIWIIRASFTSLTLGAAQAGMWPLHLRPSQGNVTAERLLTAARSVGDRLCQLALHGEESVGWIGVDMVLDREWSLLPTSADLYSGIPGIALFLAYLGALTGDERYTSVARVALTGTRSLMVRYTKRPEFAGIGAFQGLGTYIYLLSHLGMLWNDPALYREAEEIITLLPDLISKDEAIDVMAGSAGCIAALLSLYAVAPSQATLATAIQCGDHLIARAKPQQSGIGWSTKLEETPLTGFAHGNAGIALSLLRLYAASGEERFRETAFTAMEYERSLFWVKRGNWPDLRKEFRPPVTSDQEPGQQENNSYMVAWCHGAAGIGLARLASLAYVDDETLYTEIEAAFQTTLGQGFGMNHCLCHGDMGNLEFILSATKLPSLSQYQEQVQGLISALLDSIERQGWVTGVPLGIETPGLMIGIAGTGYELARLASPERMPSILLLAPPPAAR